MMQLCKVSQLINTSVLDAQISLNGILSKDPEQAKSLAESILVKLANKEGQTSRMKMASAIVRKADKAIEQR